MRMQGEPTRMDILFSSSAALEFNPRQAPPVVAFLSLCCGLLCHWTGLSEPSTGYLSC